MEFGSDFHILSDYPKGEGIVEITTKYNLYTDGRQALEDLLCHERITSIWIPSYYCHPSIAGVRELGIEIKFYSCLPTDNLEDLLHDFKGESHEALLIMNYFGLGTQPFLHQTNCLIIEDHSHAPSSEWSRNSRADWCFASLRKTLPIPDGGMLWSPSGRDLPNVPKHTTEADRNARLRFSAMLDKSKYLTGEPINKEYYLQRLRVTEEGFESLPISAISEVSKAIVSTIDMGKWNERKSRNWQTLRQHLKPNDSYLILEPEREDQVPFNLTIQFDSKQTRDNVRLKLIPQHVYPAVLWEIPEGINENIRNFGDRILSIHCDGRYSQDDMKELAKILNNAIKND